MDNPSIRQKSISWRWHVINTDKCPAALAYMFSWSIRMNIICLNPVNVLSKKGSEEIKAFRISS